MLPLNGIKVIDLTRVVAGPVCTLNLAQMGAQVIKIEANEKGDDTRATPPFINGESAYFMLMNGNKKSVTLDLKSPQGKEILGKLVDQADVLVENFRPGVLKKLGFGYESVAARNPRLIYCSVSGYGSDDDTGAYDPIIQAESGFMSVTGEPQGAPMKVAVPVGDLVSALYAVQGILYGLIHRQTTGMGQYVDISMLSSMVSLLHLPGSMHLGTGENPRRLGNIHPSFAPYQLFSTKDSYIMIACGNDSLWHSFCKGADLEQYKEDSRFMKNRDRVANRDQLNRIIEPVLLTKTTAEWRDILSKEGVPNGRVRTLKDVFSDETLAKKHIVNILQHPKAGAVKMLGNPVKMSAVTPVYEPAPLLGSNNEEVLSELGYTSEQIKVFSASKVI